MATYAITFRAGDTALTPGFVLFQRLSDGGVPTHPAPSISAVGYGVYKFTYSAAEDVVFVIDGNVGGGTVPDSDRYVRGVLSPADTMLDSPVSTRASAEDLGGLRADYTTARAAKLDHLDAPVSGAAQASDLVEILAQVNRLLDHAEGRWEIGVTGEDRNRLIIYARDGSILVKFDLFDAAGNPTAVNPFRRSPAVQ